MLEEMQQQLRECRADVGWTSIPSIHLTLKFLGEINPVLVPQLAEALRTVLKSERNLSLQLHGLGAFPNLKDPRVVWCGIHGDTEGLAQLQNHVETVCASLGFSPEDRAFRPHLTLGRVKGKRNLQSLLDCIKIGSDLECGFTADHYNVYRSTLKPQGAEYAVLKTIVLGRQVSAN